MKKLLLLAIVALTAASCEEPKGDELYMYSQEFTVLEQDWELSPRGENEYFYHTFRMDRLTRAVCEMGEVSATCYVNHDTQSQLPEVRHFDNWDNAWTETISYQYAPGEITFIVYYSDYTFLDFQPGSMTFRVVLNY